MEELEGIGGMKGIGIDCNGEESKEKVKLLETI